MTKPALGRGLGALIPGLSEETAVESSSLKEIEISQVSPNPYQPRSEFDQETLNELAQSIIEKGVIQPILVTPKGVGFELVAGERRLRAAEMAGLKLIPSIILEGLSKEAIIEVALIENLQRENLDPIDEARGYKRLIDECSLTQETVAQKVGKNRSVVANSLRLLTLPVEIQKKISSGEITPGHARTLINVADPEAQMRLAEKMAGEKMTVRSAEKLVLKRRAAKRAPELPAEVEELQARLQQHFATRVRVNRNRRGRGRIEVHFYSDLELQRVLDIFMEMVERENKDGGDSDFD